MQQQRLHRPPLAFCSGTVHGVSSDVLTRGCAALQNRLPGAELTIGSDGTQPNAGRLEAADRRHVAVRWRCRLGDLVQLAARGRHLPHRGCWHAAGEFASQLLSSLALRTAQSSRITSCPCRVTSHCRSAFAFVVMLS